MAWLLALLASTTAADTTAPTLDTAVADWTRIALEFSEDLNADSVPAASAFAVQVGGAGRALAGVSVSEDSVVLALTLPVASTDAVTVAYEAPDSDGLADGVGNAVATFTATTATNDTAARLGTQGPGLGNLQYGSAELFTPVSWVEGAGREYGKPWRNFGLNVGIMLNGYFVTLFAPDSGKPRGGFLVYDVSDPRSIRQVQRIYAPEGDTAEFREAHSLPAARIGGSVYVAIQTTRGIEIWDFTDVNDIHRESRLELPGVRGGDYSHVAWQTSWQAPYLYVATAGQGFYVVDTSDPAAPFIANRGHRRPNPVPPAEYGGFRVGPLFVMGNHLVVTGAGFPSRDGWSSLDIANPVNPVLLDTVPDPGAAYYATCFDGQRVYSAPVDRRRVDGQVEYYLSPLVAYDLTDPTTFAAVSTGLQYAGKTYCATQDHLLFEGGKDRVTKIDTSAAGAWVETGSVVLDRTNVDHGQAQPFGNLIFVGNDHGTGSAFVAHDTSPDLTSPEVVQVSPRNGAVNQPLSTRVGVAFTDSVLLESVDEDTVRLLDGAGEAVAGTYSAYLGIVNFAPAEPLEPDTTYAVRVEADGVSDYAGNRIGAGFSTTFTTTPDLPVQPIHRWALEDDADDWFGRNDGIVVGGAFASNGGLRLSGNSAWSKLDSSLSRVLSGDATLAFFLSTTQTGNAAAGAAPGVTGRKDADGTDDLYWGWLDDAGHLRLSVGDGAGIQSPEPVNDGTLHHYVLTRDAAAGALAIYRDGVKIASGTGATGTRGGGGDYDRLGVIEGSAVSLAATLSDVQVFDHVLSAQQVSRLYGVADSGITEATRGAPGSVDVAASFEAEAQGDETTTYAWDFGDDSSSAASTSRTASHTYTSPGHYTVVLTVTIGDRVLRYNFTKTVTYPRTGTPPTTSSTITGSGDVVYRVNPDNKTVTAIHRTDLRRV